ncbi:hypothetical protein [Tautonia plasticadhaerens]|uniref:Uncharacterized protein n=1 Tax=Tautonia plasticadhaerens TaxID=2527974 RepID=A0A518GYX6_9BACT|nr:hypothetical protein [Tautonia plasticadhaerens]QDV33820.1 hypothetical protein ElP_16990 [Tautonia plasticadhaerens]
MAVSAARLNANRRNSKKSTGPVTQAGKDRIRLNAWKHGFRAESDAVGPEEAEAVAARREQWAGAFPTSPDDEYGRWLVEKLLLASVRIDRCQDHQRAQARYEADRAASCWVVDREAEAAALGGRLSSDPDRVVSRLCQSGAGLDWLLARWNGLADRLDDEAGWDDAQRRLCLDLMQTPDEFREADRVMLARLTVDDLRYLVRDHVSGLEALKESTALLDESSRALAEIGLPTAEHSHLRRLRGHESALWRRFRSLEASYKAARARDPDRLDDDPESQDDPIGDLMAYARMVERGEEPEPAPPADLPVALEGPPDPRPDRSARRSSPALAREVDLVLDDESDAVPVPSAPVPSFATAARSGLAEPQVFMNRRARRALKKAKAGRRS